MSEFSESYHLRAGELQDGVDLLRAAGLAGYVFPSENGWVTILPEGEAFEPNPRLVRASAGVLLHYMHAADHGWGFALYRDGHPIARYEAEWGNDFRVVVDEMDRAVLEDVLGDAFRGLGPAEYEGLFSPGFDEFLEGVMNGEDALAERFAEAAGLTNYSWLSWGYADDDYDDDPELAAQGVVRVNAA
ncbi:MAG TPA: hypothetical protein VF006_10040 [Longimicrobium sp.]